MGALKTVMVSDCLGRSCQIRNLHLLVLGQDHVAGPCRVNWV